MKNLNLKLRIFTACLGVMILLTAGCGGSRKSIKPSYQDIADCVEYIGYSRAYCLKISGCSAEMSKSECEKVMRRASYDAFITHCRIKHNVNEKDCRARMGCSPRASEKGCFRWMKKMMRRDSYEGLIAGCRIRSDNSEIKCRTISGCSPRMSKGQCYLRMKEYQKRLLEVGKDLGRSKRR